MTVGNCDLNDEHEQPQLTMQTSFAKIFNDMPMFYRWNVGIAAYPPASGTLIQILQGTSGAPIGSTELIHANKEDRIHLAYTFIVVDIEGNNIIEKSSSVTDNSGNFSTNLIDTVVVIK